MKLIEQKTRLNPETFAPEIVVTVAIPIGPNEPNDISSYEDLGKNLADCIRNGPQLTMSFLKI